jgi:hypothetical protein
LARSIGWTSWPAIRGNPADVAVVDVGAGSGSAGLAGIARVGAPPVPAFWARAAPLPTIAQQKSPTASSAERRRRRLEESKARPSWSEGCGQAMAEGYQLAALLDPAPPGFAMIGRYRMSRSPVVRSL